MKYMSFNTVASITINCHIYSSAIQVQTKILCKSSLFFSEKKFSMKASAKRIHENYVF